jgi:hypothetical protein
VIADLRIKGDAMRAPLMRGPVILLAIFAALYVLAAGGRRLFLSGVTPIADEQAPQSMWLLDAAFLVRALENIAMLGLAAMLLIALAQWLMTTKFHWPGA